MILNRQQIIALAITLVPVIFIWQVNGIYLAVLARISISLFWIADIVQWIVLPAVLLFYLAKQTNIIPRDYGLSTAAIQWPSLIIQSIAVFATSSLAYNATLKLSWNFLNKPTGFFTFPEVFPDGAMGTVVWLYSGISAGLIESIFFISLPWLLYQNIRHQPSRIAFTLIVSVIFALAHWEQGPHNVIAAFFFNLVSCAWFFKLKTLWPIVIGHALIDLVDFS